MIIRRARSTDYPAILQLQGKRAGSARRAPKTAGIYRIAHE